MVLQLLRSGENLAFEIMVRAHDKGIGSALCFDSLMYCGLTKSSTGVFGLWLLEFQLLRRWGSPEIQGEKPLPRKRKTLFYTLISKLV